MTRLTLKMFLSLLSLCPFLNAQIPDPPAIVIAHVSVLPMSPDGAVLRNMTVTIRHGRIAAMEPSGSVATDAQRIDGSGKWLMPALTDMHVHLENDRMMRLYLHADLPDGTICTKDVMTPYLVNGVLQVVDLSAMPETVGQRSAIEGGRVLGPHIIMAAMIDGAPAFLPIGITRQAATPEGGRQAVRDAAAEGYQLIKVYGNLDLDTFTAIVDEARRMKMRVVGHIPQRAKTSQKNSSNPVLIWWRTWRNSLGRPPNQHRTRTFPDMFS